MIGKLAFWTAATLGFASAPALAEDGFYFGVTAGATSATSVVTAFGTATSAAALTSVGATAGYRFENNGGFLGIEVNGDFSVGGEFTDQASGQNCATYADGPYYCSHDYTLRLRGLIGREFGNGMEGYLAAGAVMVQGTSATGPTVAEAITSTGYTAAVGVQFDGIAGKTNRLEIVFDQADSSNEPGGYQPQYQAVGVNFGLMF